MPTTGDYVRQILNFMVIGVEREVRFIRVTIPDIRRAIALKATRNEKKQRDYIAFMVEFGFIIQATDDPLYYVIQRAKLDELNEYRI